MNENSLSSIINPRDRDLGGFSVRRLLPAIGRKMVGPFIFFDHMGPATFGPGQGMDVRPHPHIGLATVTFLFNGAIMHRDSLGSKQVIRPGDINWMTAGSGIVHSERTPDDLRATGSKLEGIQCWVALPREHEETKPTFVHHPGNTLPQLEQNGVKLQLLVGSILNQTSPVHSFSDIVYLDAVFPRNTYLEIPAGERELGAYLVHGNIEVNGQNIESKSLAIGHPTQNLRIKAMSDSHVMIIGGKPFGESREIWWNFVASSKELLERAKRHWREQKFQAVPDDNKEFIPLPNEQ